MLRALREPRYASFAASMIVLALGCVAAGTWQILRFEQSVRDNNALTANAHAAAVPLTTGLVPVVGSGPAPGRDTIRYRTVTASGTYLSVAPEFLRNQSLNGTNGYYLLSPLGTDSAVLLVVRGFVAATSSGAPPASVTRAPSGPVTVIARLQTISTATDDATALPDGMIESVNAAQQAARLGAPVYQAYATLGADQPGTSGVSVLPNPDLSNPAGGAYEGQHFAYIVQWYLFALLALAAPFVIRRHEIKDAQRRFLGIDSGEDEVDLEPGGEQHHRELAGSGPHGAIGAGVAVRAAATIARRSDVTPQQLRRAARLADRYGRSLGLDLDSAAATAGQPIDTPARAVAGLEPAPRMPDSAANVHRSEGDDFHGAYNDYLWELALADGNIPSVSVPAPEPQPEPEQRQLPEVRPIASGEPGEDRPA